MPAIGEPSAETRREPIPRLRVLGGGGRLDETVTGGWRKKSRLGRSGSRVDREASNGVDGTTRIQMSGLA